MERGADARRRCAEGGVMALTVESASTGTQPNRSASIAHGIGLAVAALVAAAALGAAVVGWPGGVRSQLGWLMLAK